MIQSEAMSGVRHGSSEAINGEAIDEAISSLFVIDDDASQRESLEELVKMAGWEAEGFASADEFLSQSREPLPSCVMRPSDAEDEGRLPSAPRDDGGATRTGRCARTDARDLK